MNYPIAALALLIFPVIALVLFKRLDAVRAAAFAVLGGSLFLPEVVALDFPVVPPMDKEYVTYLSVLLAIVINYKDRLKASGGALIWLAMWCGVVGLVATMLMNPDPLLDEGRLEPGLSFYWLLANTGDLILTYIVPFVVGAAMFRNLDDLRSLLRAIVAFGVIYTVLITIEVVLSVPFYVWQLSQFFYQIPMRPMWRWNVIQPVVFMDNGLSVATFMAMAVIGSAAFSKSKVRQVMLGPWSSRWLNAAGLFMTRNVAGNVYGIAFIFVYMLLRPRAIARVAVIVMLIAVTYPALRMLDVFPDEPLVSFAAGFDADRARSLEGRFLEEDLVLGNIENRLWVGWGNVSRTPGAETFGQGEPGLDSWWVITLGARGLIGVFATMMLLAIPVAMAWRRIKSGSLSREEVILLSALMAMVAVRAADLLINGWWNCLPVFLAGALFGIARSRQVREKIRYVPEY